MKQPRPYPHAEDPGRVAGGDTDLKLHPMARHILFSAGSPSGNSPSSPPGEDKFGVRDQPRPSYRGGAYDPRTGAGGDSETFNQPGTTDDQIENRAMTVGLPEEEGLHKGAERDYPCDFLQRIKEAEASSNLYMVQVNRRPWTDALLAFHQEHSERSKYRRTEYNNRTKFFRAKTRSAVRKDLAALAASLFNAVDAITCLPGNEADPKQKAAAELMQELVNYRTNRTSMQAALPWFLVALGARVDSYLQGICISKQSWKVDYERVGVEMDDEKEVEVWKTKTDRPDSQLIPPENAIVDPAADWTNPAQNSEYFIIKWPMRVEEIHQKQKAPVRPWKMVDEAMLMSSIESSTMDTSAIRRAREQGLDRMDEQQTGYKEFKVIWVYETFMRAGGKDWTFYSLGDHCFLTDPEPVEDVYPEQNGLRPIVMGYASLEPHRIYPMSPASSLQQYQRELNDIANLSLDALKQQILPITKVVRGGQVDLDQVKKRGHGTPIMMNKIDDVSFERPTDLPQSLPVMTRSLELEMDDLAGQFNGQTTQDNNALARTLGGLKLVAGSANAVQELDIRLFIETWCEPVLAQIVHLEQYYEHDPIILGLCGQRAGLVQKHGIDTITNELLEQEVAIRVSVGLGAGDPQQRLAKFSTATQIVAPIIAQSPEFQKGELEVNIMAIIEEVYGAAGYKDAGDRFFKPGQPQQNPMQDLAQQEIQSKIQKNKQTGQAALMTALADLGRVTIGKRQFEEEAANKLTQQLLDAHDMGHQHAAALHATLLKAIQLGHDHGHALSQHHHQRQVDWADQMLAQDQSAQETQAGGAGNGGGAEAEMEPPEQQPLQQPSQQPPQEGGAAEVAQAMQQQRPVRFEFIRDPRTGRITGATPIYADQMPPGIGAPT